NVDRIVHFVGYHNGVITLVGEVKVNESTRRFVATMSLPEVYVRKISPEKNLSKFVKTFNEFTIGKSKTTNDGETVQRREEAKDEVSDCTISPTDEDLLEFSLMVEREMKSIRIMEKNIVDYDPNKSGGIEHCRLYILTFD
ncbi:hypothetical protein PMAYCL1PPCAC_08951, partial [Pristionchus mayeri]